MDNSIKEFNTGQNYQVQKVGMTLKIVIYLFIHSMPDSVLLPDIKMSKLQPISSVGGRCANNQVQSINIRLWNWQCEDITPQGHGDSFSRSVGSVTPRQQNLREPYLGLRLPQGSPWWTYQYDEVPSYLCSGPGEQLDY